MTTDLKSAQDMLAAAVAARNNEDPEITSIKHILKLLDKTSKSNRTYGSTNPVAQKFTQQLYEALTSHLSTYTRLTFLVQRSELLCKEQVVYQPDQGSGTENVAFKLYADGIRELAFYEGLSQEDLLFFLDSLWAGLDPTKDDDDIVTRLWSRNLSTIVLATAEELSKSSISVAGAPSADGRMNSSDSTLRELLDRERNRKDQAKKNGDRTDAEQAAKRVQAGLTGYDVTEEERATLALEIETESNQDHLVYIMNMLTVILASEKSPALLTKLFSLWGDIIESLLREGKWTVLEHVVSLLHEVPAVRPDLSLEHQQHVASLLNGLGRAERIKAIESYLNQGPTVDVEGLSAILLLMNTEAIPSLCTLLGNVTVPAHQTIVAEVLTVLAKDHPDPLLRGLLDRRPGYVRQLLSIFIKWNNPKFIDSIEKIIRYPDPQVRREVVRAISLLRPRGNGAKLVPLTVDEEESVRFASIKLLMSGQYTVPFSIWSPLLAEESFTERPLTERRAIFQAIRATCGDEAIEYWQDLVGTWSWTNRKKKDELAVLAAETLGKLATPAAIAALELGVKKGSATVRQACTSAIGQAQRQQKGKQPTASGTNGEPL